MNEPKFEDILRPTRIKSTVFDDGMIVTADDLNTAMLYPIGLFQTLVRAYFGCGIVCGLEVSKEPEGEDVKTYCVKIKPGVALDCEGYPLALCESVKIDLTPDPCVEPWPEKVCIAIRRDTSPDDLRDDGDGDVCDSGSKSRIQHRRQREQVLIRVFPADENCEKLPDFCARPEVSVTSEVSECDCLKACPSCSCCGESWVLLACVTYLECTVQVESTRRKYVKPIECICREPVETEVVAPPYDDEPGEDELASALGLRHLGEWASQPRGEEAPEEATPDETPPKVRTAEALNLSEKTVDQAKKAIRKVKDLDVLKETRKAEASGKKRKGVRSAIEARMKELKG